MKDEEEVFEAVAEAPQRGEQAALVTIIRAQGSTPQRVGAKMLVFPEGRTVGTIGGGCYENEAFGRHGRPSSPGSRSSRSTSWRTTSRRARD